MKIFFKPLTTKVDTGGRLPIKETPQGKLYVAYLNKPLIDLGAITEPYGNDYYGTAGRTRVTAYTRAASTLYGDERIPVILSQEDERMLQEGELSEYY